MTIRTKLSSSDIDGYPWNWEEKYAAELAEELIAAFSTAFLREVPTLPVQTVQRIAAQWAAQRTSKMIGDMEQHTKEGIRTIVSSGIDEGQGIKEISRKIKGSHVFSKARATLIARTETATALGGGQKEAAIAQGRDQKRWITIGGVDDECAENESQGWISITDNFSGGVDTIPQHPSCRCVVNYRTKELHELLFSLTEHRIKSDFRCPDCQKLLARNAFDGTRVMCRYCKKEQTKG